MIRRAGLVLLLSGLLGCTPRAQEPGAHLGRTQAQQALGVAQVVHLTVAQVARQLRDVADGVGHPGAQVIDPALYAVTP